MENPEGGTGFLHEPLTQRERNILAHLANDRSSQEIAGLETLAHSSVKWYIHQVYAKLRVNRRRDAIVRARELGLLRSAPAMVENTPPIKNNLPRQLTSFIGREEEIKQLTALVRQLPLVTLTGSGGTGKTRLALQVAGMALPVFPDGVWLVDLTPLADPELVTLACANALGMREISRSSSLPALSQFIGSKNLLIILDNCEHLVGAAAALARELLHACPQLHILATSREVLGVNGEKTFRCPPLSLPELQSPPSLNELTESEAVRLFTERAQNVTSDFRLTESNALLVARVCRRLDGIPLAIELAAARVRLLSMDQITARLDDVFHLLTGGGRIELPRHQTLKALVDWSYNLLSAKERGLLCRLSVFAGSWTLEAAEAACACPADEDELQATDILDLLGQLADKSLVNRLDEQGVEPRYRMLEMIRQYAHHRLQESGEVEILREQHLDYYLALGLQAELCLRAKDARKWKVRLAAEIDNIRQALEWSLSGSIEKGLRLAAALQWFWAGTRSRIEGVDWLNRLLAVEASGNIASSADSNSLIERKIARGKALNVSSYIGRVIGQNGRSMGAEAAGIFKSLGELYAQDLAYSLYLSDENGPLECLEMFRKVNAPFLMSEMVLFLSQKSRWNGELPKARSYAKERWRLSQEMGDQEGETAGLWELGLLEFLAGHLEQAGEYFRASQACCYAAGSEEFFSIFNRFYAWIALAQGDIQQAIQYSQAQLAASSQYFVPFIMTDALGFLGWEAFTHGDEDQAVNYCEKALNLTERPDQGLLSTAHYVLARAALSQGDYAGTCAFLKTFFKNNYHSWPPVQLGIQVHGILAARQMDGNPGQARRAATLFGAQDIIHDCLMNVIPQPERAAFEQAFTEVQAALSAEDFNAAYAEGRAMTTAEAIQYALDDS
jgi:predicted ATPase/DNA-binding CsgD family transcriptional regulator